MDNRLILAVKAGWMNAVGWSGAEKGGLVMKTASHENVVEMLSETGCYFGPRDVLEEDPTFRQIIPYVLVRRIRRGSTVEWLTHRRGKQIEEQRLAGRLALGLGGHIDLEDATQFWDSHARVFKGFDLGTTINKAAGRELFEEIGWDTPTKFSLHWQALIVDSTTPVSQVHVGVIGVLDVLPGTKLEPQEDALTQLEWFTQEELLELPASEQEGWTEIVAGNLHRLK